MVSELPSLSSQWPSRLLGHLMDCRKHYGAQQGISTLHCCLVGGLDWMMNSSWHLGCVLCPLGGVLENEGSNCKGIEKEKRPSIDWLSHHHRRCHLGSLGLCQVLSDGSYREASPGEMPWVWLGICSLSWISQGYEDSGCWPGHLCLEDEIFPFEKHPWRQVRTHVLGQKWYLLSLRYRVIWATSVILTLLRRVRLTQDNFHFANQWRLHWASLVAQW